MKLIACGLSGNCELFLDLSMSAMHPYVDKVILVFDTSSKDKTKEKIENWKQKLGDKLVVLEREYEHDLKVIDANNRARTFYLDYLKQHYDGEWCITWDMDEIADENISKLKSFLETIPRDKEYLLSPRMEHFIQDLSHIDSTREEHFCPHRLFTINQHLYFFGSEHPVLNTKYQNTAKGNFNLFTLWHLAYCREMFYILERYKTHSSKSDSHPQDFLKDWLMKHLTGEYQKKKIDITTLPKVIREHFLIDNDYFYFRDRMTLEIKHLMMCHQWKTFFRLFEPNEDGSKREVLDTGCGVGHYIRGFSMFDVPCDGFDISSYAINNTPHSNLKSQMWVASVLDKNFKCEKKYHLVMFSDILEHLNDEEEVNIALQNGLAVGNKFFLFSIPFDADEKNPADPNLRKDKTHKIFWTRDKWIEVVENNGIKLIEIPKELYFNHQLLIGIRKDDKSIKVR
ncbi:MAG: methyltransferase domain-containing protein [archaeon]|nr:methyltransferase domain-containing protein [archaeon]